MAPAGPSLWASRMRWETKGGSGTPRVPVRLLDFVLRLDNDGDLVLLDVSPPSYRVLWSAGTSGSGSRAMVDETGW